jgi:hypothetical protein
LLQAFFNPFQYPLRVSQITLPDSNDVPTGAPQRSVHQPVTGFIPRQFLFPESTVVRRPGRVLRTAMPETTVNEDCLGILALIDL